MLKKSLETCKSEEESDLWLSIQYEHGLLKGKKVLYSNYHFWGVPPNEAPPRCLLERLCLCCELKFIVCIYPGEKLVKKKFQSKIHSIQTH